MARKEKEKVQEKTPEELQAEKRARGDFVEETDDVSEAAGAADEEVAEGEPEGAADDDVVDESPEVSASEEEIEAAAEEEEDEPGAKDEEAIMVPKGRLDEVLHKSREREQELQRRLDAAETRKKEEATTETTDELDQELEALDTQYGELLLEGELEKAAAVRKEWRQKQNDLFDIRLEQRSTLASRQAIEGMRFDRQLAEYEVKFPVINPDSEDFNQEVANEVSDLMGAFEAKGWNPVAALNKAVKYVVREDSSTQEVDADTLRTKRKVAARKKVADVAKKSPPDIVDKGRDTDKVGTGDGLPDVTKMTPEQFSKLTDAQLRELRGDTITDQEAV
jgi:hypothetical protein